MRARNTVMPNKLTPNQRAMFELTEKHKQKVSDLKEAHLSAIERYQEQSEHIKKLNEQVISLKNSLEETRGQLQRALDSSERAEVLRRGAVMAAEEISKGLFGMMNEFIEKHQIRAQP